MIKKLTTTERCSSFILWWAFNQSII